MTLDALTSETREVLAADLAEWGAVALAVPRDRLREVLPTRRADRLWGWVRQHGATDPRDLRRVTPPPPPPPPPPADGRTHLVIGDCHAAPGQDLQRFRWLGRMIRDLAPDVVVSLGDWYSLDSICAHRTLADRSKERVVDDLRAGEMALAALESELGEWSGRKVITLGNHDDRLRQLGDSAPWLEGLEDVGAEHRKRGWEVVPFLAPCRIDGVLYQHYATARGSGRALAGKHHAARLLERYRHAESVVVGHSHQLQHRTEAVPGRRVHALVAGCYFEHTEDYAGEVDNADWWRGIVVLRGVRSGDYDLETWSMDRIRARWGG